MISNASLNDGKADRCYFFNAASSDCSSYGGFDTGWTTGTNPWSRDPNLDLEQHPGQMTPRVASLRSEQAIDLGRTT